MRIAHIITGLEIGGAEIALERLVLQLCSSGFDNAVWSLKDEGVVGRRLRDAGVAVHPVKLSGPHSIAAFARLARGLRSYRPQVVHGWMYHGNLAALAVSPALPGRVALCWNVRCSTVGLHTETATIRWLARVGGKLAHRVDCIVNNSHESVRGHVELGYPADRTVVIPNGFDVGAFGRRDAARAQLREQLPEAIHPQARLVAVVGRAHAIKGHEVFLNALARARAEGAHLHAVMIGSGLSRTNPSLRAWIEQAGVRDHVSLLGSVMNVQALLPAFDIFVSSSLAEGFPNAVGEAMSCGIACIATAVGDTPWLMGDTGVLVQPGDVAELARAMCRLARMDEASLMSLGSLGQKRVIANFSLERVTQEYADLYNRLARHDSKSCAVAGDPGLGF